MRSVSVRLADLNKVTIPIGFVGENLHTQVRIDCVKLFEDYPNAVPELTVNPPMGDTYPAVVTRDGDYVIWDIEDSDLIINGNGEIQLSFFVDEVIAKSYIARIRIEKSLVSTGDVPGASVDASAVTLFHCSTSASFSFASSIQFSIGVGTSPVETRDFSMRILAM